MHPPDEPTPAWAEALVKFLDDGLRIPGTQLRIGADALLGLLLPVAGDAAGVLATLSLFSLAVKRRVPRAVLVRMALNVAIDALVGSVPILGDGFDLVWKANRKNLELIQQSAGRAEAPTVRDRLFLIGISALVVCALALPIVAFAWVLHALFAGG
jgi:Domain of unknown function (DUF4112)